MRTTIRLADEFYEAVREHASQEGKTVTAYIEEALRAKLAASAAPPEREPYKVVPYGGGGPRPGIDLTNNAQLEDIMDGFE
ncbi:ribbon-helix-helix protein, CopG family [Plantibacter sp. CFBP 8804]|uniref:ribbon-helix-helix protein, CopG family n=1 Tax=Plantibacter sp. CFBP 8804 TaxID=2775270 RepID=UPI0017839A01|nr:ribbon-helix-helix protein, CopG family [Plantibacter sp. CFBP 8804]MBD8517790.1 ribbon-helix-helix protein, CopG family [Plantibacter sp. CFBP 8804]